MKLGLEGLDDVLLQLANMGRAANQCISDMLDAGEAEVVKAWQTVAPRDTGDMMEAVKGKRNPDGFSTEVYPRGKDRTGTRNAEKAFVLHYGTKRIPATHWVDLAEELADSTAYEAMQEVFDNFIDLNG